MAGNEYTLYLKSKIKEDLLQAQLKAFSAKTDISLNLKLNADAASKLESQLKNILASSTGLGKVKIFGDEQGNVNRAVVTFTDNLGKSVTQTVLLNEKVKITRVAIQDIAKEQKVVNQLTEKQVSLRAKEADKMSSIVLSAEKFLEKSKTMGKGAQVTKTTDYAKDIVNLGEQFKQAFSAGNYDAAEKYSKKIDDLNKKFQVSKEGLKANKNALDSWTYGLKNAIKQSAEYITSLGLIYGVLNQFKEGIKYVTELNKEMTNIQIVAGYSKEEIQGLAKQYNALAKEMGATTIEVAQGSLEWIRQGKNIQETEELLKSTLMLSKLGNVATAESTEYLTAILNGFKLEAKDATRVVDRLVVVDNKAATSVKELATMLQRSSVTAQQAGVSFEELVAMEGVVSSVTRRASESIGEAFKTIFTRFQDIKEGRLDEEGMGINNVEDALSRVGVATRDVNGQFRDFTNVLEDLYPVWKNLDSIERANIAKALAGTRQRETLLVLLENESKYRELVAEQMNAEGLAMERYEVYLDNVEASQKKMTASWEKMWQTTINSDGIKFFYDLTAAMLDAIDAAGGLVVTLGKIALPALIGLEKAVKFLEESETFWKAVNWVKSESTTGSIGVPGGMSPEQVAKLKEEQQKISEINKYTEQEISKWKNSVDRQNDSLNAILQADNDGLEVLENIADVVSEESKKAFDDLLEYTIKMIKQRKEAEIDALKVRLDSIKEERKALEDSYEFQHSEQKRLRDLEETRIKNLIDDLKYTISMRKKSYEEEYEQIEQNFELQEQALESQLESYESLIDAQIRLLENKKKEIQFEREMEDRQQELAEIQARILELSFDDSAEAIAERMRLMEQAAEMQEEIDEAVADNQIDQQIAVFEEQKRIAREEYELQMAAIEAAKRAAEIQHELRIQEIEREEEAAIRRYELRLRELEEEQEAADYQLEMQKRMLEQEYDAKEKALESQITQLQQYLDEEGTIANDARKMLAENSEKTYQELIEWNKKYGDGLKDTIVNTWELALDALNEYKRSLESLAVPNFSDLVASLPSSIWWNGPPEPTEEHHSGLDSGFVGGVKGDEKIIKALKGELVLNKDDMKNFTQKTLPSMMMGSPFERESFLGGVTMPITFHVAGNMDEKIIPDIKAIMKGVVQELNKSVSNRGFVRQTSLTSI